MFETHIRNKKAIVFEFDNVLYPEKDYLLQVYYLFSEFMAYSEQIVAQDMLAFMQSEYTGFGTSELFEKTAKTFNIPENYKQNFELLHQTARLPLKLLLYKQMLSFLQEIVTERKDIYLFISGDPLQQINKIKQTEWHGLEKYLKTYFTSEFEPNAMPKTMDFICSQNQLDAEDILMVSNSAATESFAASYGISCLNTYNI